MPDLSFSQKKGEFAREHNATFDDVESNFAQNEEGAVQRAQFLSKLGYKTSEAIPYNEGGKEIFAVLSINPDDQTT